MKLSDMIKRQEAAVARAEAEVEAWKKRNGEQENARRRGKVVPTNEMADVIAGCYEAQGKLDAARESLAELRAEQVADDEATRAQATITPTNVRKPGGNRTETVGGTDSGLGAVEAAHNRGAISSRAAERIEAMTRNGTATERSLTSEWAAATGSEDYLRAFAKVAENSQQGHLTWTPAEHEAFARVQAWRSQMQERTTLLTSGYVLPLSLDPAIMLTNAGAISGIADSARVETVTVGNAWRGLTSAGASHTWGTEGAQLADNSPTTSEVSIPLLESTCNVVYSFALQASAIDLENQLADVIRDAVSVAWAAAFATGDGSTAPQGLITGLAGTASEINGTGSEALAAADVYALQNALPARFSRDARWLSHVATANTIRRFETTNGAHEFPEMRQSPAQLLGKPWLEESSMDSVINAAATENNYALVYGDIAKAYVVALGVGSVMEMGVQAYGANGRPATARHAFMWTRIGAEVVNIAAARLLDIPTTA